MGRIYWSIVLGIKCCGCGMKKEGGGGEASLMYVQTDLRHFHMMLKF